jgi:hypothetical protein
MLNAPAIEDHITGKATLRELGLNRYAVIGRPTFQTTGSSQ